MNKWIRQFDWKYLLPIFITIVLSYPSWLPLIGSPEKGILIQQVSQTALQPNLIKDKALGLEITIDKIPVNNPYLTIFKIENIGRQPIRSEDFEGDLQLYIDDNKTILRAGVSEALPDDLIPSVSSYEKVVNLEPVLINPNDSITLSILSTNGAPAFRSSARIAGVQSIKITTKENETKKPYLIPFYILITLLILSLSNAFIWRTESTDNQLIKIHRRTANLASIVLYYISSVFLVVTLQLSSYLTVWNTILSFITLLIISIPITYLIERRPVAAGNKLRD